MKKITTSDKYAIHYLHDQNKTISDIASELKLPESTVKKIVNDLPKKEPDIQSTKQPTSKDLMIKQTSVKKNPVAIMTEGAAQRNDEFVKNMSTNAKNTNSYIFRRTE